MSAPCRLAPAPVAAVSFGGGFIPGHYARAKAKAMSRFGLRFTRLPIKISKHGGDELLSARHLRSQRSWKQIKKIARLRGGFAAICGRRRERVGLQFILPQT